MPDVLPLGLTASGIRSPRELLEARADMYAGEPALAAGEDVLSYGDWLERAERLAARLREEGVRPGDTVLLKFSLAGFLPYAVAYIATLSVGAVAVPLAEELVDEVADRMAAACRAAWTVSAGWDGTGTTVTRHTGRHPASTDRGAPRRAREPLRPEPADVAEILFTSGSTGEPQGVLCPYGEIGFAWDLTPPPDPEVPERGRELHAAAFGTNFCQEMLRGPLTWGSLVVTLDRFGQRALREAISAHGVTTLRLNPVMARMMARQERTGSEQLSGIREISVSSAFCPPEVLGRLQDIAPNAKVVNQYSLTESGRAKIKNVWGVDPADSLGRPVEGSQVRIVSAGRPLGENQVGEIQIRHLEAMPREYLSTSERDAAGLKVTEKAEWVSTGDLGHIDGDGYVFLLDRAKDIINVGGRKVSPLAVERVIAAEYGIADVAVCGIPHATLGEIVVAMVVLETGVESRPSFDLSSALQPHEIPKSYAVAPEIPRNHAGKIARELVRTALAARPEVRETGGGEAGDALHGEFREICLQVLEQPVRDLDSSWYNQGGDSLSALEMMSVVEDRYGVHLPEELFFGESSLRGILDHVRSGIAE